MSVSFWQPQRPVRFIAEVAARTTIGIGCFCEDESAMPSLPPLQDYSETRATADALANEGAVEMRQWISEP